MFTKPLKKKVLEEFVKPGPALVKKMAQECVEFAGDSLDPQEVFDVQMPIVSQHRQVTLALQEYHKALSRALSESGIILPSFESLIASALEPQE